MAVSVDRGIVRYTGDDAELALGTLQLVRYGWTVPTVQGDDGPQSGDGTLDGEAWLRVAWRKCGGEYNWHGEEGQYASGAVGVTECVRRDFEGRMRDRYGDRGDLSWWAYQAVGTRSAGGCFSPAFYFVLDWDGITMEYPF